MLILLGVALMFGFIHLGIWMKEKTRANGTFQEGELHTLKRQIENDLELFVKIHQARVLFDLHPSKSFPQQKVSKASVLLSLAEGAFLTEAEVLAISYHVASAIGELDVKQISITDTEGRLYKKQDSASCILYPLSPKESIAKSVDSFLQKIVGKNHYSFFIECTAIHLLIDEKYHSCQNNFLAFLLKEIHAVDPEMTVTIDWSAFEKPSIFSKIYWAGIVFCLIVFGGIYGIKKTKEHKQVKNVQLAELIKNQPPKTLAIMLSYLEPGKAKKILDALPLAMQEEIANHFRMRGEE